MHATDLGATAQVQPAEGSSCELLLENSPIRSHYSQEHANQILDEAKEKITHDVTNVSKGLPCNALAGERAMSELRRAGGVP